METKEMSLPTVMYPEVVQPSLPDTEKKTTSVQKIAVISVSVLIGLVLILGSVLLAVHLVSNKDDSYYGKEKTITAKDKDGKDVQEKVYVNTKTKEEAFQTTKINVVHDFSKGLTMVKVLDNKDQYVCYLTTLNSTGMISPAELEKALSSDKEDDQEHTEQSQKEDEKFQQTAVKVTNREFLSPKSKEMCEGHPIYWMISAGNGETNRQKRAICSRKYCYYYYYWWWRRICFYLRYYC